MRVTLRTITPAVNLPVEREDMLLQLRLSEGNPLFATEILHLEKLMGAATKACEDYCARAFVTQVLEMIVTPEVVPSQDAGILTYAYELLPDPIKLWRPPLQGTVTVTAVDLDGVEHVQAAGMYSVNANEEPGTIRLKWLGWWEYYVRGYYKIRYTAGYGLAKTDVPIAIRNAIELTTAQWYMQREKVDYTIPPTATALLDPYVIHSWELK